MSRRGRPGTCDENPERSCRGLLLMVGSPACTQAPSTAAGLRSTRSEKARHGRRRKHQSTGSPQTAAVAAAAAAAAKDAGAAAEIPLPEPKTADENLPQRCFAALDIPKARRSPWRRSKSQVRARRKPAHAAASAVRADSSNAGPVGLVGRTLDVAVEDPVGQHHRIAVGGNPAKDGRSRRKRRECAILRRRRSRTRGCPRPVLESLPQRRIRGWRRARSVEAAAAADEARGSEAPRASSPRSRVRAR
mmetsp:Transcript_13132/g.43258  ORF Transcript_13132/g.43258 Transcript_13132/m.43258 type:complete len:248 (+) Transcript_13132:2463-3206(+)